MLKKCPYDNSCRYSSLKPVSVCTGPHVQCRAAEKQIQWSEEEKHECHTWRGLEFAKVTSPHCVLWVFRHPKLHRQVKQITGCLDTMATLFASVRRRDRYIKADIKNRLWGAGWYCPTAVRTVTKWTLMWSSCWDQRPLAVGFSGHIQANQGELQPVWFSWSEFTFTPYLEEKLSPGSWFKNLVYSSLLSLRWGEICRFLHRHTQGFHETCSVEWVRGLILFDPRLHSVSGGWPHLSGADGWGQRCLCATGNLV